MMKAFLLLPLLLILAACAGTPLKLDGVNRAINPAMVTAEHPYTGMRVVWGGMLIKTEPLKEMTQIEVLAFPVSYDGEPDRTAASLGRFMIVRKGFLEPADFAPGRWVSVVGAIGQAQTAKVGEADYRFPVIHSEQLYLWPVTAASNAETHFYFGIGIQF
jgi:outer membrane lipoprotein